MENDPTSVINQINEKLKNLNLENVVVKKVISQDLSAYGRAHSLEGEQSISISGELDKSQKDKISQLNTFVDTTIKPALTGFKVSNSVSCPMKVGDKFESVTEGITDLDGNAKTLEHKPGVVMVIDFWATWCGPCQNPMKHNQKLLEDNPDWKDKVRIIGFGLDKTADPLKAKAENLKLVEHYHAAQGFQHPVVSGSYQVKGIPNLAVFDKDGIMQFQGHPSEADLDNTLPKLIDGTYKAPEKKGVGSQLGQIKNLKKMDGSESTIEADGKVMLIDFWATWCGPCQKPMQHNCDMMNNNKDKWTDKVRIIGLSCDDDLTAPKNRVADKKWDNIEQYHLAGGFDHETTKAFKVTGIPHCVLVDKDNKVLWKGHPSSIDLEKSINDLVDGKEFKVDSGSGTKEVKDVSKLIAKLKEHDNFLKDMNADSKPWILLSDTVEYLQDGTYKQTTQVMRRKQDGESNEKGKEFLKGIQDLADEIGVTIRDV